MVLETEGVEQRLKSFVAQLRTEFGILHRIVYKNKNQHRRSTYFQFLLKVVSSFLSGFNFFPYFSLQFQFAVIFIVFLIIGKKGFEAFTIRKFGGNFQFMFSGYKWE